MTEEANSITQPIAVNRANNAQSGAEDTQPIRIAPETSEPQLPAWLLKFASAHTDTEGESLPPNQAHDLTAEEDVHFVPPEPFEDNKWLELSDFQEHDADATHSIENDFDDLTIGQSDFETPLMTEVSEAILSEDETAPEDLFHNNLRDLLSRRQIEEAAALIRQSKSNPDLVEVAKKTLRGQLTLSADSEALWEVYDELNSAPIGTNGAGGA